MEPAHLPAEMLDELQRMYPPQSKYGYTAEVTAKRGISRAEYILRISAKYGIECRQFLELACGDGMVCATLNRDDRRATGIDLKLFDLDQTALHTGAIFLQMDAERMSIADSSMDCVFSFNSFEHFMNPEKVLSEAMRVIRPGGILYLDFGPVYFSPSGLHAYRSITVPYCQILFSEDTIHSYILNNGLRPIDNECLNRYSIEQYRNLWAVFNSVADTLLYNERIDISYLDLIRTYASCFKNTKHDFDNFIISSIEILLQKKKIS